MMLNVTQSRSLILNLQKSPFKSIPSLTVDLVLSTGVTVHPQTVRNVLYSAIIHGRYLQKKPFISETNCVKHLTFAKEYANKPSSFWQTVIFSDETKYNLFRSDGCGYVWRKKLVCCNPKIYYPCKILGGKVLVWGCMAASGGGNPVFIDGHTTAMMCVNILRANLKTSARKLGLEDCFHFQQDNNPKHTVHFCCITGLVGSRLYFNPHFTAQFGGAFSAWKNCIV